MGTQRRQRRKMEKEFLERGVWSLLKSEKMGEVGPKRGVWLPGRAAAFREPPAKKPERDSSVSGCEDAEKSVVMGHGGEPRKW